VPFDWSIHDLSITSFGLVYCEAGWRLDDPWSNRLTDHDLICFLSGEGKLQLEEGPEHLIRPGLCLWARPGRVYRASQNLEHSLVATAIHFDLRRRGRTTSARHDALPPELLEAQDVPYANAIMRRIIDLCREARDRIIHIDDNTSPLHRIEQPSEKSRVAAHLLRAFLLDITSSGLPDRRTARELPQRAERDMHEAATLLRDRTRPYTGMKELARSMGYAPDYFGALFKSVIGMSPHRYALTQRIEHAKSLLRETALSVGEIAESLGYANIYYFSRQFSLRTGLSPSAYRERHRTKA